MNNLDIIIPQYNESEDEILPLLYSIALNITNDITNNIIKSLANNLTKPKYQNFTLQLNSTINILKDLIKE